MLWQLKKETWPREARKFDGNPRSLKSRVANSVNYQIKYDENVSYPLDLATWKSIEAALDEMFEWHGEDLSHEKKNEKWGGGIGI
jgi:hypothetical protein